MTDMSNTPATVGAWEVETALIQAKETVSHTFHMLGVLDEAFGNGFLVHISLSSELQRESAEQVHTLIAGSLAFARTARDKFAELERLIDAFADGLRPQSASTVGKHLDIVLAREWNTLMRAYETAKAAEEEYEATTWKPEWERSEALFKSAGGSREELVKSHPDWAVGPVINDEMERLQGVRYDLRNALMAARAPDAAALRWKLDLVLEDDGGSLQCWSSSFIAQTIADYRRLLGGEG